VKTCFGVLGLGALISLGGLASGQQTVFNVPSADVLEPGKVYLETDQYVQRWKSGVDDAGLALARGVYGLSRDVEVGLNAGPFDYEHSSVAFLDAAVKWKAWHEDFGPSEADGSCGVLFGNTAGVSVHGDPAHDVRDYAYGATFAVLGGSGTRVSAGPYYATQEYFSAEARFGAQLTFEQPIRGIDGLTAAADWISGDGGSLTTGFVWSRNPWTLYAGYGFANSGRDADLLTLEVGVGL